MIESGTTAINKIANGVNALADAVKVTLGPLGKNAILYNKSLNTYYATKDGVSVAKEVYSSDSTENAAINILREASLKTAKEAGDGTTTSLILAQSLFNIGNKYINDGGNITILKDQLSLLENVVHKKLDEVTKKIDYSNLKEIENVATISANNDTFIGNLVADAYNRCGKDGVVTFELSSNGDTYIEEVSGTEIMQGLLSTEYINNYKRMECSYDNPYILLINNTINSFNDIVNIARFVSSNNSALVIIANSFGDSALRGILRNNAQGNTKILPIQVTGFSGGRQDFFLDLKAVTGASILSSTRELSVNPELILGKCSRVVSKFTSTVFYRDSSNDTLIDKRVEDIKGQIEVAKVENPDAISHLEQRIAKLKGKISIIYVGGKTEVEAKEKYDRVEDAVCAVKAALEEGIVEGGGTTFLRIGRYLKDTKIYEYNIFNEALFAPFNQLCYNAGLYPEQLSSLITSTQGFNFLTGKEENLFEAGILDPVKVLKNSLSNAISVVTVLLNTHVVIY